MTSSSHGLLEKRVVVVTGKGGVGKTTVALALGAEAARRGRRTLVAELSGSHQAPGRFDQQGRGYEILELAPDLFTMSITPQEAIEDYVVQQLRFRSLYRVVFENRVMAPFMAAVPGLHDLVQLGKVWEQERATTKRDQPAWDLIIVDAPATGHGLTLLNAPRSMMDLTTAGPFYDNARRVQQLVEDPVRTALVLVALPEELPVNETLDLYAQLGTMASQVELCVLNEMHPEPFDALETWSDIRPHLPQGSDPWAEAVRFTGQWVDRALAQRTARNQLRAALPVPHVELPFLFQRDLGPGQLASLGQTLCGSDG